MIATLMEWAGTMWGMMLLAGVVWFVLSCVFSLALGSIIAKFGGDGFEDGPRLVQPKRRSPRRVSGVPGARKRGDLKKTSTG